MEFCTNGNPWIVGLPLNDSGSLIELKAFQLISIVNGSKESHKQLELKGMLFTYEMSELSRLLVEIAVFVRNNIDLGLLSYPDPMFNMETKVGYLLKNLKNIDNCIDLTIREACNKIIHAKHINFDLEEGINLGKYDYLNPFVYLYGDYQDKDWKAQIDINTFVATLMNVI